MRVRWIGEGAREVPHNGEELVFERLVWVDAPRDLALSLAKQDGFELEAPKKAAKTRAANDGE
jgi:hypothetical protein